MVESKCINESLAMYKNGDESNVDFLTRTLQWGPKEIGASLVIGFVDVSDPKLKPTLNTRMCTWSQDNLKRRFDRLQLAMFDIDTGWRV